MYRRNEFDEEIHKGKMIEGTKIMWKKHGKEHLYRKKERGE